MAKAKKMANVKALEKFFQKCKENGREMVWRITETLHWYNIQAEEEGLTGGYELAYYQTADWSEIVEFCGSHCNPGNDTLCGLGCTNQELANATIEYIHSMGKKHRYEEEDFL